MLDRRIAPVAGGMPLGAELQPGGGVHFRVWAPACERVDVVIEHDVTGKEAGSAYLRRSRAGEDDFMVVLNLGSRQQTYLPPANVVPHTIALSTHQDRDGEYVRGELKLRADEGLIICVTFT